MLLVDEEEPRVRDRREGRRPRPDHGARLPGAHAIPGVGALALRERGVENRGLFGELPRELPREDGGERDLRHQPDGAATRRERLADGPQVHLGLPAAGDALQKRREVAPPADRGGDGGDRARLAASSARRRRPRRAARPCSGRGSSARRSAASPASRGRGGRPERHRYGTGSPRGSPGRPRASRKSRTSRPFRLRPSAAARSSADRRLDGIRRLGRGSPPLRRGHGAHPAPLFERAERLPAFAALPGQVQDPHRISSGQPRQDRAFVRRRLASRRGRLSP